MAIDRALSEGKVTNYELTARDRDGNLTVVSYNATTFHDRDRRLQGVFASARDMTELKAIEKALTQKNAELEDASRMKSEFLANMSHELRTPLNAIIGFSEVLGDGLLGDMTEKQRRFIGDIFKSGKHLLSLINDILDLSKVEAGKMLLDLDMVEIAPLLKNSLSIVKGQAAVRHVRLDMQVAADLGTLTADARKVKQIVYNLLSNAVKFTADGGDVILRADRVARGDVGVLTSDWASRAFPLGDSDFSEFLRVSVTDNGIGMAPEGLEQLFKPFSQVDSSLARQFEGTGLGLAMVKLLVDLHGGVVAVESAVGAGSCFTVWIPMRTATQAPAASPRAPVASHDEVPDGARIALVVESNYKSAELIRVQLEAENFTVIHAYSSEEAISVAQRERLALVTLDIMMPDVDGWAFLHELKSIPSLSDVPVIIISILADRTRGFALGAAAVMQSPVSRQELYDTLAVLGLSPVSGDQRIRVLIVDDDPKAVDLVAIRMGGMASEIFRAFGGREAIEIARRELPDLIVLDLIMPDVNGFDVVDALNTDAATADIPVMVVTASAITAAERARLNGFVTTVMGKTGFDGDQFIREVRRAMAGHLVEA
jgi:signal transduction histidine kinase/CheY-like chemotaxis protein